MIDPEIVGVKLNTIAQLTEELSAELFDDSPELAKRFGKIAIFCRKINTCLRLHGQVPVPARQSKMMRVVRSVDLLAQTVKTVVERLPRTDYDDEGQAEAD